MSSFPRIHGPCPYLDRLDTIVDHGFCRKCRRDVHDLTVMDEQERADFVAGCGDACVSYTMSAKPAVAAALIAASAAVLVAPEAISAKHPATRSHQHQPPRPVPVPRVQIRLGGIIAPPPASQQAGSGRPVAPPGRARKPD